MSETKGVLISKSLKDLNIEPKEGMMVAFYTSKAELPQWYVGCITNPDYKPLIDDGEKWVFVEGPGIFASYKISDLETFKILYETKEYCLDYNYWIYALINNLVNSDKKISFKVPYNEIVKLDIKEKVLSIEAQVVESHNEARLLHDVIEMAFEAGYTEVHDHWGHNAWDEYTILEALERFKPVYENNIPNDGSDDLPF